MKRLLSILLTIYVLIDQGDGTFSKATYVGQSQKEVETMLANTGRVYTVVDSATFDSTPEAPLNIKQDPAIKQQAVLDALDKGKTLQERFEAYLKASGY